jgi:hypothetical protein
VPVHIVGIFGDDDVVVTARWLARDGLSFRRRAASRRLGRGSAIAFRPGRRGMFGERQSDRRKREGRKSNQHEAVANFRVFSLKMK